MTLAPTSFYMRPLPSSCISFNSAQGKQIFANALNEGHLDSYFLLAGQFVTQNEPAYCALATLCMVLNAYGVDPQRIFKGPWRFYDQSMLSCCRPLEDIALVGMTLSEFACLARCNGLTAIVEAPRLDEESRAAGLTKFRADLLRMARGEVTMALSYSRTTLGQTGDGHFSCIGAYSEKDDKVLCLDVARFKYPSYWIDVELAYDSMLPLDKATGQPRGYALLSPMQDCEHAAASLTTLTVNKSSWAVLSSDLTRALLATPRNTSATTLLQNLAQLLQSRPINPIAPRLPPSSALKDSLYPTLRSSKLGQILHNDENDDREDSLMPLLLLTLLSPKSALTSLVPPGARQELTSILNEATRHSLLGIQSSTLVRDEVDLLVRQLGALGECCRAEEEGAACGCSGPGKIELEKARAESPES